MSLSSLLLTEGPDLRQAWEAFIARLLAFLPNIISAAIIIVLAMLLIKILRRPINALLKRTHLDEVAVNYIHRTNTIVIWVLAVIMVLDKLGVPVGSLLAMLAAVGAAIALAIKDNLSNFASGMVLLFTKPFKAGDFIEVEGTSGTIREIELVHTYLDTTSNTLVAIPNSKMMTATITNYSTHEVRRQDFSISIGYGDDLRRAKELLLSMVTAHAMVLQDPAPIVRVKEHGSSAVVLLVRVWCKNEDYWELQFDLLEKIKLSFDENGISIPFNQLDVHMISPQMQPPLSPQEKHPL